jgi:hypothetical protein
MWEGVYGMGNGKIHATISQNKGTKQVKKTTTILVYSWPSRIERGFNNQP